MDKMHASKLVKAMFFLFFMLPQPASADLNSELNARKTINPFMTWYNNKFSEKKYGLFFSAQPPTSSRSITLNSIQWNMFYPDAPWDYLPGVERFIIDKDWQHAAEYGKTLQLDHTAKGFSDFIGNSSKSRVSKSQSDGVFLDFWFNGHPEKSFSPSEVKKSRKLIVESIRDQLGEDKIIMGNVAWNKDSDTVSMINGVFLELVKPSNKKNQVYTAGDLKKIESLLDYYERNLRHPKIIALNGWRATSVSDQAGGDQWNNDRNTPENRRMAKILTAMSVVVPTNGYILYSDSNHDSAKSDHGHIYYDFYKFDIGKPVSKAKIVTAGVRLKAHERGFIAYNISRRPKKIEYRSGESIEIEAMGGLFCQYLNDGLDCLSYD